MKRLATAFVILWVVLALASCQPKVSEPLGAATGSLTVVGATALNGGLTMDTNKFTVADSTGNVVEAGSVSQTQVNVASASANPWDYTGTLGIMNGTDDFTLFDVNITNANHTSTGNTVQALDIAGITADADATETAINIGNGWDVGLNAGNNSITTSGGITGGALTGTSAALGGGYFSTGCTAASTGTLKCTDDITSDADLLANTGTFTSTLTATGSSALNGGITVDTANFTVSGSTGAVSSAAEVAGLSAKFGGGYFSSGCTGSSAGAWQCTAGITSDGAILGNTGAFTTTLAAGSAKIGGGYYSTGCSLSSAGAAQCTAGITSDATILGNAGTFTGTLTAAGTSIGGGYFHTGCTGADSGTWKCTDDITSDADILGNTGAFTSTLTATGSSALNGGITVDTSNFTVSGSTGAVTVANDVTVNADSTGGNALAVNQFIGVPRIAMSGLGLMADGTTQTVLTDIGDSETPATDWTAIDADVVMSNDSSIYRQGTASLKMAISTAVEVADGTINTLATGNQDWTDDESVGFWMYSTKALDAGDLTFVITDSVAGLTRTNIPAIAVNTWTWQEVNISGIAATSKDVITDVAIDLAAAGVTKAQAGAFNVYFDFIVKWDAADEEDLGYAILQDGVLSVVATDMTNGAATTTNLVQYTNYFVHYQSGNDAIVPITDLADADLIGMALVAY